MKFFSLPCVFFAGCAFAQSPIDTESYLTPPKEIKSYFDLPRHTQFTLSNLNGQRTWFARVKSRGQTMLSDISNPYENFGGLTLDTRANRARTMSYRTGASILLTNATTFEEREITPSAGQWVSAPSWSPDGSTLMFLVHNADASTVYLHNVAQNKTWELTTVPLLATRVTPEWLGNSKGIVMVLVPGARGAEPKASSLPSQPKVQVTDPDSNRLRTYRTLLQNQTDRSRLEYFLTGQLAVVDIAKGSIKTVGSPTMISSIDASPTGDAFRVTTTQKPFSYLVPMSNFGSKEEIWDANGKSLVMLSESKLRNGETAPPPPGTTPTPPVPQARRQITWAPDGNGLIYIRNAPTSVAATPIGGEEDDEQRGQGGGGGARGGAGQRGPQTVAVKEELVRWTAPYGDKDVKVLYTSERGFPGLTFSPDGKSIFITESVSGTTTQLMIPLDNPSAKKELWSWKPADAEKAPGSPVLTNNAFGVPTLDISSGTVLMRGTQSGQNTETNPPRPFLDSYNVAPNKITRLWQCRENVYETIDGILSNDGSKLLINHQSPTEVPNDFLYEGGKQVKQITKNVDCHPTLPTPSDIDSK